MDYHHCSSLFLGLTSFLLISFSTADDATIMAKLSKSISPTPSTWHGKNFCEWEGIICDGDNNVTSINLANKSLTGTLPSDLNSLPNLITLAMQGNSLSGPVPTLSNTFLEQVILDSNNFTSIPSDFFQCNTNFEIFSISDNSHLSPWSLPNNLVDCGNLQSFQARNANIHGTIPDIFSTCHFLENLSLSYNNLTGTLPSDLNSPPNLRTLALQGNSLSGPLPTLSNLAYLEQVILDGNYFTSIPSDLFYGLTSLQSFSISDNLQLSPWSLPNNLIDCTNLRTFQANQANIYGTIPDIFGRFPNLQNLSLSYNNLTGSLPASFRGSRIQNLRLNNQIQGLSGTLDVLSTMTQISQVWLEGNEFTGAIPELLTSLPELQLLDVSNNNLSGRVPVFPTRVDFSSENNPILEKRIPNENINTTDSKSSSGGSDGLVIGIVISGVIFVIGVILFVSYKCYRVSPSKLQSEISVDHCEIPSFKIGNLMISVQVLQQVTENFSDENVLGRGGFGVVYKGEFDDGTKIAVKRMKTGMKETKGMNEFEAEIAVLTKVRHRHLVALLGYCANKSERLLVYEYMPQGTLSQHLFKWRENASPPLSWKQRVSIALDVGKGVEYLHSLAQESFIHRDLKPANILLGDDMRAKVADFGLVKITANGEYSVETRVAGTFGYLAPEYSATGRVTSKVDVYSFGVVLMQLITARKALDDTMPYESCQLATWFRRVPVTKENMVKYVDKALDTDDHETLESIIKVAELAKHCTTVEPFHRPDMGYVVNVLGPLLETWRPLRQEQENTYYRRHMSLPQALHADEDTYSTIDVFQPNSF